VEGRRNEGIDLKKTGRSLQTKKKNSKGEKPPTEIVTQQSERSH